MSQRTTLPKLVIFGDPAKGPVAEAIEDFTRFLRGKAEIVASCYIEKCTADVLHESDFAIVFGGDGSIISAARDLSQAHVPVIGVNLGKLGYLAEFSVNELKEFFDNVVAGKAPIERRMLLGCWVSETAQGGREKFRSPAVNEVFITAGPPFRMIELEIAVDGQPVATCVSDGLIVSTPTGSTAYNLSAGGPILAASMEAMVITPICPHSLSFRPIVIDARSRVEVRCTRINEGTTVSIDGQVSRTLATDDVVRVAREASSFLVVNNPLRTPWQTLASKLGWAERPRYQRP
ncbi:MAG: NAD(+)/NADH kinase [Sedimentisphaerales bacterium]|jgi:NAD+ kinase|nr:NAD(+)/NADH kinase [Planctomycetota bacterium]MDY0354909.1 NAD(+)/NADH kinase [Sedimentisphaerales bacterium]NLT76936.1 NAD(+)/NADH kinase [Planctomycetota bacterium]